MRKFPKDFLWGSASAAYQIEGAYNDCLLYTSDAADERTTV